MYNVSISDPFIDADKNYLILPSSVMKDIRGLKSIISLEALGADSKVTKTQVFPVLLIV